MDFDHFEKELKQKFQEYNPVMDEAAFWDTIAAELPAEERPRRGFLWIWFLAGLLLMTSGLLLYSSSDTTKEAVVAKSETAHESQTDIKQIAQVATDKLTDSEAESVQAISLDKSVIAHSPSQQSDSPTMPSRGEVQLARPKDAKSSSVTSRPSQAKSEQAKTEQVLTSDSNLSLIPAFVTNTKLASGIALPVFDFVRPTVECTLEHMEDRVDDQVEVKNSGRFSYQLGLGYAAFSIRQTANAALSNEEALEALSADFRVRYKLNSKWLIHSGLLINRNHLANMTVRKSEQENFRSTEVRTLITRRYNAVTQLTIPIGLSYAHKLSETYGMTVGLAYELGIHSWNRGYEQGPNDQEYNITTDKDRRYADSGIDRLGVETAIHRQIGEGRLLSLGLYYKRGTSNIYNEQSSLEKTFDQAGLSIALLFN